MIYRKIFFGSAICLSFVIGGVSAPHATRAETPPIKAVSQCSNNHPLMTDRTLLECVYVVQCSNFNRPNNSLYITDAVMVQVNRQTNWDFREEMNKLFRTFSQSQGLDPSQASCVILKTKEEAQSYVDRDLVDYPKRGYSAYRISGWHPYRPYSGKRLLTLGSMTPPSAVPKPKEHILVRDPDAPPVVKPVAKPATQPKPGVKPAPAPKKPTTPCGRKGQRHCKAKPM
jgi:hypothetical protein